MIPEIFFTLFQAVVSAGFALVGIEMANHPPRHGAEGRRARNIYRTIFTILAILSFGSTMVQTLSHTKEREKEQAAAHDLALKNESDMRVVKSGLATIYALVSHLPPGVNSHQLASVVQHVVREALPRERVSSPKNFQSADQPSSSPPKSSEPTSKQLEPLTTQPEPPTKQQNLDVKNCDLDGNGVVNIIDVDIAASQVIGRRPCTIADLTQKGQCTVSDIQRVMSAALGKPCLVTR